MSFYIDKNYARQHYVKNSLLFVFVSTFVFFISFLLIVFYVSNISIMILATILMILSIVFTTISLVNYFFFSGYESLIISETRIQLSKFVSFDIEYHPADRVCPFIYDIVELNNIEVNTKYIILTGNFILNKETGLGLGVISGDIKNRTTTKIKIPRIFSDEDKIVSSLNDIKKGSV